MKIRPPVEEELRRVIRDARAADPLITVSGLERVLENRFERGFSRRYIAKLADKIHKEALIEADRTQLRERLNVTREKFRIASERLMEILNWEAAPPTEDETFMEYVKRVRPPKYEDIIEAAKTLGMLELALLRAEMEYGQYKDVSAADAESRERPTLPEEQRNSIVAAFGKWGMLKPGTVARLTERSVTLYAGNNGAPTT